MNLTPDLSEGLLASVREYLKEKGLIEGIDEITFRSTAKGFCIKVREKVKKRSSGDKTQSPKKRIEYLFVDLTDEDWDKAMSFKGLPVVKEFLARMRRNGNKFPISSDGRVWVQYSNIVTFHSKMRFLGLPYRLRSTRPNQREKNFFEETYKLWRIKES